MKQGEIYFCDIETEKGIKKNVVYKIGNEYYKKEKLIKLIKIHSLLGNEVKTKKYTEVKKSDEKRNKITGAYD